jgi:sugar phosphate isomerase/epimerase
VRPRLSFGSWAFSFGPFEDHPWDFDAVCRYVADAGYDGIEINGFRPHPHDEDYADDESCARLKDRIDGYGLGISAFAPDFRSTPPADAPLERYLDRIDSVLAFCRRMDIGILRTDTISAPGPFDAERFDRLVTAWRHAARRAADAGVLMVWEFEPGFWLNRPSHVLQLLDAVGDENFRVLFDTSHAFTGVVSGARQGADPELLPGGAVEYARMMAPYLGHLHLIDSDGSLHDEETSEHVPFGRGLIDFDAVIDALGPAALRLPWWTIDFCYCPTTEEDGGAAVPFVNGVIDRALAGVRS